MCFPFPCFRFNDVVLEPEPDNSRVRWIMTDRNTGFYPDTVSD